MTKKYLLTTDDMDTELSATSDNPVTNKTINAAIGEKQSTANLVTSWEETVSDSKYPSEKLVSDSLDDKQNQHTTATATLTVAGWDSTAKTQTVSVTGAKASNTVMVSPDASSYLTYGKACIRATAQAEGTVTFTCSTVPTSAINVNVVILP